MRIYPFANPEFLALEDKLHDLKVEKSLDISDLYELVFKFDKHVDSSFKETATELDTIRSHLARRGQEIANLEGGYDSLEKEIESLKVLQTRS